MARFYIFLLLLMTAPAFGADPFVWQTDTPEAQGMSPAKLNALRDDLAKRGTTDLLIIRHDKIVLEYYGGGFTPDKPHGTASMAKAVIGGMSLALGLQDGRLKLDDPVSKFVPQWRDDPRKSKITFTQLATHMSGLDDATDPKLPHDQLPGWKGEFWKREPTDPFTIARDSVPVIFEPGQRISYSNPGMAMLSYAVTAAIQPGEQKDVRSLLRERIFKPLGIEDNQWTIGYGKPSKVEGMNLYANWGGASFTPRAVARIGRLMLHEGDWNGQRILDPAIVRACANPPGVAPNDNDWQGKHSASPGLGWWSNRQGTWKGVPRDTFVGAGAGHQFLIVIPSLDLIAVRNGTGFSEFDPTWWSIAEDVLLTPLAGAVVDAAPYPPSKVIHAIHFDDDSKIIRKAYDSDNWPITWGDDDQLYTAYGDGHGFEPLIKPKLSLGYARVEGSPPSFNGINIRSDTGERTGNGAKGEKASGMLMVDGVLYMWVRNTKNATLAWSTDHAATWTQGFSLDTSFGCPALLNFGRNYTGARDDYVYTYSQDGPSAYEPYDGIVMARVLKTKIREKAAYEFCAGLDASGNAKWTTDITQRAPIFHYPGHCERVDVAYSAGLHRYLMALSFGQGKGWGIFDAKEPWGPWTTAYTTHDWGHGETHGYRLPTKWMSPDGKEMHLIFSGRDIINGEKNDAFCVRRFTVDLNGTL